MSDTLRQPTRRSFLRGSSLFAVSAVLAPRLAFGATEDGQQTSPEQSREKDSREKEPEDKPRAQDSNAAPQEKNGDQDETSVTKKDDKGREYRICPQCGYNMYRQERTWTCENCGYSYTE